MVLMQPITMHESTNWTTDFQGNQYASTCKVNSKKLKIDRQLKLSSSLSEVKELYRIINTNSTARSTPKANNLKHILSQIRYVVDRLNDIRLQSEAVIQKTNKYYWSLDDDIEGI